MRARMHEYAGALSFLMPRALCPMSDDASGALHPRDSFPHREEERSLGPRILSRGLSFICRELVSLCGFFSSSFKKMYVYIYINEERCMPQNVPLSKQERIKKGITFCRILFFMSCNDKKKQIETQMGKCYVEYFIFTTFFVSPLINSNWTLRYWNYHGLK